MKILVVDSNRTSARRTQRLLSEEGYETRACGRADDALHEAESSRYGLVLIDGALPNVDGLKVCRTLRNSGSNLPIMMLSARAELRDRVSALHAGVDDFLGKPFATDELLARIAALLRRAAERDLLTIGDLRIDPLQRKAQLQGGYSLRLSKREFSVLLYLAQNADQVVTRSKLMMKVWATQLETQAHLVEVVIHRLREKLIERAWMIETVRGRGYRLRSEREAVKTQI